MKKAYGIGLLILAVAVLLSVDRKFDLAPWTEETPLREVLAGLGEAAPDHMPKPDRTGPEWVERGRELMWEGITTGPDGEETRLQSRYFRCISCHNMDREDPDLADPDPEARLTYVQTKGMPFLQGTTLFGTVNKESWYNGDYFKKYGDLVKPANKSLKEAIQLCATVCSQGRAFEEWEMDAVLAYLWSISYDVGDISLSRDEMDLLNEIRDEPSKHAATIKELKTRYRQGSPATFLYPPEDLEKGYPDTKPGDPLAGRQVYDQSCLHCHDRNGPSNYLKLDHQNLTLNWLRNNFTDSGYYNIYRLIRKGTYADKGHRAYMPNYTAERMSNQQVEDLRAYVSSDLN